MFQNYVGKKRWWSWRISSYSYANASVHDDVECILDNDGTHWRVGRSRLFKAETTDLDDNFKPMFS